MCSSTSFPSFLIMKGIRNIPIPFAVMLVLPQLTTMNVTIFDLAVTRLFELALCTSEGHQHGRCPPWSIMGDVGENQEFVVVNVM